MTELFRCRVDRKLLKEATRVCDEMGTTPGETVRMLFAQLVKKRALPFTPSAEATDGLVNVEQRNRIWGELDGAQGW